MTGSAIQAARSSSGGAFRRGGGFRGAPIAFAVLILASLVRSADALKVTIGGHDKECFNLHADHSGDTFVGSFNVVEDGTARTYGSDVFDMIVKDEDRSIVYSFKHSSEHKFEFNTNRDGAHEFCFTNNKGHPNTLYWDVNVGHHWAHDAATDADVDELGMSLDSMREMYYKLRSEVIYQKHREAAHRRTADTITGREMGFSVLNTAVLIGVALFQTYYVKQLFESKRRGSMSTMRSV